jgi:hypothetical protein
MLLLRLLPQEDTSWRPGRGMWCEGEGVMTAARIRVKVNESSSALERGMTWT